MWCHCGLVKTHSVTTASRVNQILIFSSQKYLNQAINQLVFVAELVFVAWPKLKEKTNRFLQSRKDATGAANSPQWKKPQADPDSGGHSSALTARGENLT